MTELTAVLSRAVQKLGPLLIGLLVIGGVQAPDAAAGTGPPYYLQLQDSSSTVQTSGANLTDADQLDTNIAQACPAGDTVNFYAYAGIGAWDSAAITRNDAAGLGQAAADPYYRFASAAGSASGDQWVSWPALGTSSSSGASNGAGYAGDGTNRSDPAIATTASLIGQLGAGTYTFAVACQDASNGDPVTDGSGNLIAASRQVQVSTNGWAVVPNPITMDFSQLSGSDYSTDQATLNWSAPDLSGDQVWVSIFNNAAAQAFATSVGDPSQASWDLGAINTVDAGGDAGDPGDPFFSFKSAAESGTTGSVGWPDISADSFFNNAGYQAWSQLNQIPDAFANTNALINGPSDAPSYSGEPATGYGPGIYTIGLFGNGPVTNAAGDPIAAWVTIHIDAHDKGWQVIGSGSSEATALFTSGPEPTSTAVTAVNGGQSQVAALSAAVSGFDSTVVGGGSVKFYEELSDNSTQGKSADPASDLALGSGTYNATTGTWDLTTNPLSGYTDPNSGQPNTQVIGPQHFYAIFTPDSSGQYQGSDDERSPASVKLVDPPTAALGSASVTALVGQPVMLDGSGSSAGKGSSGITDYSWAFSDPGANNVGNDDTGATSTDSHTFTQPGTYTATLTVTEDGGSSATASELIDVKAAGPTAVVTATPTSVRPGKPVTFDASASTAQAADPITEYLWDFGDGVSDNTITATDTHSYATAGTYTATVTVKDVEGQTAQSTVVVTVANPAPPAVITRVPTTTTRPAPAPAPTTTPGATITLPPFGASAKAAGSGQVLLALRIPAAGTAKVIGTLTETRTVKGKRRRVTVTVWRAVKSEQAGAHKLTLKPTASLRAQLRKRAERVTLRVTYTRRGAKAVTKRLLLRLSKLKTTGADKTAKLRR